jgi:hypothetical protein
MSKSSSGMSKDEIHRKLVEIENIWRRPVKKMFSALTSDLYQLTRLLDSNHLSHFCSAKALIANRNIVRRHGPGCEMQAGVLP